MTQSTQHHYKSTESKYKGGAQEMYITYDVWQETRGENRALYPKVKRIYIAGKVTNWQVGNFTKRSGKDVYGVKIDYEQSRTGYSRQGYTATRDGKEYQVAPAQVGSGKSSFSQIIEIPEGAENVKFHEGSLPQKYRGALQNVR